jgi:hypothetical protein
VEKRKQHGCTDSDVFGDPDDPQRVWVVFDWKIEDYKRFLSDPEIPAIAGARPPRVAGESWSRRPVRLLTALGADVARWDRSGLSEPATVNANGGSSAIARGEDVGTQEHAIKD